MISAKDQILTYIKASFPLIHVLSDEFERVYDVIEEAIEELNTKILPSADTDKWLKDMGMSIAKWDCVNGLVFDNSQAYSGSQDLEEALRYILNDLRMPSVIVMENVLSFLNSSLAPILNQLLIELHRQRYRHKHIVIVSSEPLPQELRTYTVTIDFPLPSKAEIKRLLTSFIESNLDNIRVNKDSIANICVGMNALEIESALCVSAVSSKKSLDKSILYQEKAKAVQKSGLLELLTIDENMDNVGGLDNLKDWFKLVAKAFKNPSKAEKYKLPNMKGVLIKN